MTHQNTDDPSVPANDGPASGGSGDEFEDAVTTEISAVMARAFGNDYPGRDYSHVEVTDVDLSAEPLPAEFDVLEPGFVLGKRFEVVELVHSGGMSHVYKAIDLRRHRSGAVPLHVAIKTMRRLAASQHDSRRALEHEAARAQRLSHPNIINVFDFDEHEGQFYLVMEWLDGESLNALLKRTKGQGLDPAFAWPIIESVASAVQHAHRNNIVHADINPSNVFITTTHEIKLLDFGVARDCGDKSDVAGSRLAWATQTYASPEVLEGMSPVFEDDIFSLGCVAYRLLSGNHPFDGLKSLQARDEDFKVAPIAGLSDEDWQTIRRALDYSRSQRPKTSAAFRRSAQGMIAGSHVQRSRRFRPWRWLLAGVIAIAVAASGWWAWSNLRQSQTLIPVTEPIVVAEPAPEPVAAATPAPAAEPAAANDLATEALLASAALAMSEQRFLQPREDNARDWFRQVLELQPDNPAAQRGLRLISDTYVRRAEIALRAGNPADSAAALAIAADTDARNPAIEMVEYMLIAQGDQQLADARAAALAGDAASTAAMLALAEQYAHIDEDALKGVREILVTALRDEQLQDGVAAVDERIINGRLLSPDGDNAHALLLELIQEFGADEKLVAAADKLGQRLLTSAALASATGDHNAANRYLDAIDALAIVPPGVAAARASLQTAIDAAASAESTSAEAGPEPIIAPAATADRQVIPETPAPVNREDQVAVAATNLPALSGAAEPVATAPAETAPVRRQLISELGIQRYVAPKYPRSARRNGISGFVEVAFTLNPDGTTGDLQIVDAVPSEVFNASAEKAVRQWRFAPREQAARARIVLSFQVER